ncbi:hypothetical protein [Polaribacter aestuariivivens]|uniref:hypothetical protein n=1 Tax=Polaribacter aestuariivivens TaxID=2304626 RepID=UPI003F495DE9
MTTTIFEDKLKAFLGLAEKASHGYYISNGVYHQNLEKVDVNAFIEAVKNLDKMFAVAFENKIILTADDSKHFAKDAFWNDLKRQKQRFDSIHENQLDVTSNKNNVAEILEEVEKGNPQVKAQLKKAVEGNLTILPMLFFRILNEEEKVSAFNQLQSKLIDAYYVDNDTIADVNFDLAINIADEKEIMSWFITKEELNAQKKQEAGTQFKNDQEEIEKEKQEAIDAANKEAEAQMAAAKKAQEDALKLMAEMQKKYGLNS